MPILDAGLGVVSCDLFVGFQDADYVVEDLLYLLFGLPET